MPRCTHWEDSRSFAAGITREKSIHLEDVTGGQVPAVVDTEGAQPDAASVEGIHVAETVELAVGHQIQGNLSGREEIVAAEVQLATQRLFLLDVSGVVASALVARG